MSNTPHKKIICIFEDSALDANSTLVSTRLSQAISVSPPNNHNLLLCVETNPITAITIGLKKLNHGTLSHHLGLVIQTRKTMSKDQSTVVVCVEDEPEMIDLIRLILKQKGFEVLGAEGGVQGLAIIQESKPDLVLLDLMMPDMDGWEVYQQLKASDDTKDIPVIVVTAKAQDIDRMLGLHIAKVDDYVPKPFTPQELIDSVDKVLRAAEVKP